MTDKHKLLPSTTMEIMSVSSNKEISSSFHALEKNKTKQK